jgi:mannose-1-phosphate guanylyltransferase
VEDPSAFGVVETDDSQRVKRFIEKPPLAEAPSHWINAGTYILEPAVLGHIPAGRHYMFEKGLFPRILELGLPVFGYPHRGYWLDVGTPKSYFTVNMDMLSSRLKSPFAANSDPGGIQYGPNAVVDPAAVVTGPALIGDGCRIGRGARVKGPVVMGPDCRIEAGAGISESILWDGVNIGAGASLSRCIIASGSSVPAGAEMVDAVMTASHTIPFNSSQ